MLLILGGDFMFSKFLVYAASPATAGSADPGSVGNNISVIDSDTLVSKVLDLMSKFALIGGALWAIWGVMVLAGGLKDKNGPALQAGIWQIVGGALILIASVLFQGVVKIE